MRPAGVAIRPPIARWMSPSSSRRSRWSALTWVAGVKLAVANRRRVLSSSAVSSLARGMRSKCLILERRRQLSGLEDHRRLIVELAELRVARAGERDHAELAGRQTLRHAPRRIGRFAGHGRVGLQGLAAAGAEALNDENRFARHQLASCPASTVPQA